ncbi:MAG: hypothetical protein K0S08_872 [Gammaproteobacteria bacterium]|jgi:ATP-binding cassette subfamily B protein|nr:hypothetical protein [Gammaproteobacteria bacterium]
MIFMLPKNPLSFIFHFIKKQKVKFLYLLLTSAMWAINDALFPYFIKHIVNGVQFYQGPATKIFAAVATPLIALIALWAVTEIAGRSQGILSIYLFPKFRAQIRESILHYIKQHSHEYFANQFAGNIAKKLSDLPTSC